MTSLNQLSLSDEEDELDLQLEVSPVIAADPNLRLVGRFLTNRPIRSYMMMEKIKTFWNPVKGVDIHETEPGLFTFQFNHHLDMNRILKKGPWYFDNHLLVLDVMPKEGTSHNINLQFVPFWIQVHDLPTGLMSEKVGQDVANFIGEFLEYDAKNNSNFLRPYMRIRVLLDVTKPLKRQKKIKKPGGVSSYIRFKYERLGNYCYFCGLLGHIEDFCEKLYDLQEDDGTRLWGPDLRVDKQRSSSGSERNNTTSKVAATVLPSVTATPSVNSSTINETIIPPKPAALANLLRNPNLIRSVAKVGKAPTAIMSNHELVPEENDEVVLSSKLKRSRNLNAENQHVTDNKQPPIAAITHLNGTTSQSHQSPSSNSPKGDASSPMDVSQPNPFLSAEPGSQACRAT
jgi:hypothetical protein